MLFIYFIKMMTILLSTNKLQLIFSIKHDKYNKIFYHVIYSNNRIFIY